MASLLAMQEQWAAEDAAEAEAETTSKKPAVHDDKKTTAQGRALDKNISAETITARVMAECADAPALRARFAAPQFARAALRRHVAAAAYAQGAPAKAKEDAVAALVVAFKEGGKKAADGHNRVTNNAKVDASSAPDSGTRNNVAAATALKETGNAAFISKNYAEAIESYATAVRTLTEDTDPTGDITDNCALLSAIYANLAACYLAQSSPDLTAAVAHCELCLALSPDNIKALHRLATAQMRLGLSSKALSTFNRGLALDEGLYATKASKKRMGALRKARRALLDGLEESAIDSYAFSDDGKPSVKVYITLPGVELIPRDDISCEFQRMSMDLRVRGYEGTRTMRLFAAELWSSIEPDKCKLKVKPGMLVVTLRKQQNDGMRPWERLRRG